jgi:hypothetical protein
MARIGGASAGGVLAARGAGGAAAPENYTSLRWSLLALILLFCGLILYGVDLRSADLTTYQRYYDAPVSLESLAQNMGPAIQGLSAAASADAALAAQAQAQAQARANGGDKGGRQRRRKKAKEDIPDSKNLTGTSTVWDFLYLHSDQELIHGTRSQAEEEGLKDADLNVITLLIKKVEKERADEWLVQLALWFYSVAKAWPKDIQLSPDAIAVIEKLIAAAFSNATELSDDTLKALAHDGVGAVVHEAEAAGAAEDAALSAKDSARLDEVKAKVAELLETPGAVTGNIAKARLEDALEVDYPLEQWRKLLIFIVAVAEAAPMFAEYLVLWRTTSWSKVEEVVWEASADKKASALQTSASLLAILERGCEKYPRTSRLIRASLLEELDVEDKAEAAEAAEAMASDAQNKPPPAGRRALRTRFTLL